VLGEIVSGLRLKDFKVAILGHYSCEVHMTKLLPTEMYYFVLGSLELRMLQYLERRCFILISIAMEVFAWISSRSYYYKEMGVGGLMR
jgi:hypothetical protein